MDLILRLSESAPSKGLEMSVVLEAECRHVRHPVPFLLHYSKMHRERYREKPEKYLAEMNGVDPDLAAYFEVVRRTGTVLCGAPVDRIFGEVPYEAFFDSIRRNAAEGGGDASGILNLCRYAAFAGEGRVLSKRDGGFWGLKHLPERWRGLIRCALDLESGMDNIALNFNGWETFRECIMKECVLRILSLRDAPQELERFIRTLREEHGADRLESVVIRSWASPEGVNRLNGVLSERRADSLKSYLVRHAGIPDSLICIHGEGIAWDMLRQMVAASDILYKEEVLHILDHTPVWVFDKAGRVVDGRKKQLMDLRGGMPYTYMLENFFPELRSSLSVACYRKPEPPVKVISQKETKVKEPEPALQPDSVAEPASEPATVRKEATVQPHRPTVQRLAVKTNLLYDAILMPSLEVEYRIADRWTVNLEGDMAWWNNDGKHKCYQVATISPEGRWWFGQKQGSPWHGHYLGVFGGFTWYDLENGKEGYQGEAEMVGVSYGYMFPIGRRLSLEAGIGLGYMHSKYEEYLPIDGHYVYQQTNRMNYFGPLKLKFALVWRLWDTDKKKGGAR